MSRDADAPAGTPEALRPVPTTVEGLIRQRLSDALGGAIAAFFALRSGNAEDAFLPGILTSLAYGVAAALSVVLRWPSSA